MLHLYFATQNQNKLLEVRKKLNESILLSDLSQFALAAEIPETGKNLEENSKLKAQYIFEKFKVNCFADDSGLEVDALNGAPGIFSARYAGEPKSDEKNTEKLLAELSGESNRKARFRTVIALILEGKEYLFEGIIQGQIANAKRGTAGFGYDPVFIPEGEIRTFAEMNLEEKNRISHRAIAVQKLVDFLKKEIP